MPTFPADQNFNSTPSTVGGASLQVGDVTYSQSASEPDLDGVFVAQGSPSAPSLPLGLSSNHILFYDEYTGSTQVPSYVEFKSTVGNFRISSFDFYAESNNSGSTQFEIQGFRNGTEVISAALDLVAGLAGSTVTYTAGISPKVNVLGGKLEFASGTAWDNVDTVRLVAQNGSWIKAALDNLDFEPTVEYPALLDKPARITVREDTPSTVDLSTGTFTHSDAAASLSLTIQANAGTLSASSSGNVEVEGGGTGTLTLKGTASNIDTFLNNATNITYTYTGASNTYGLNQDTLTLRANDGSVKELGTVQVDITAVADTPTVTPAATPEDTQSSSGLVITRNAADGAEVTHFKITGITGGTLYKNDGTMPIGNGDFITVAEGGAGLKFTPTQDLNSGIGGPFTFQVQGAIGTDDTSLSPAATASITVNAVNDAPTLTSGGTLAAVDEDTTSPIGAALSSLNIGANDIDGLVAGYAIVGNNADAGTQGRWQYSSNNGDNWFDISSVSDFGNALALSASTMVRFVPVAGFSGTPTSLVIRALDDTYSGGFSTTVGNETRRTVDTSLMGGDTAVSVGLESITTSVTHINHAPTITTDDTYTLSPTDEDVTSSGTLVSAILTGVERADVDSNAVSGIAVTGATGNGTWQFSSDGGNHWADFSSVTANASLLLSSTTQVRYVPNHVDGETASFTFRAWDQTVGSASVSSVTPSRQTADTGSNGGATSFSMQTATTLINVSGLNDAPTLTSVGASPTYNEGSAAAAVFGTSTVSTVETGQSITGLTFTISNVAASDRLTVDGSTFAIDGNISSTTTVNGRSYSVAMANGTATVTVTGTMTAAEAKGVVEGIALSTSGEDPIGGTRAITLIEITDDGGTANNGADTATLNTSSTVTINPVNDAPTLIATAATAAKHVVGATTGAALFSNAAVSTVEAGQNISSMTIKVGGLMDGIKETLVIAGTEVSLVADPTPIDLGSGRTAQVTDAGGGLVAVTIDRDTTYTTAEAEDLIEGIKYKNTAVSPTLSAPRTFAISMITDDGGTANGGQNTATITTISATATVASPPPPPPPPPPPANPTTSTTVDGVTVGRGTQTNSDGTTSTTVTIPVVTDTRSEQVGQNTVADIPLVTSGGNSLLSAQVPTGLGLTVTGSSAPKTAGSSLTDLIREIQAHTQAGSTDQTVLTGGGSGFLADIPPDTPLLVQSIVPTAAVGATTASEPLVITGTPTAAGNPYTALVIDTRGLPSGTVIQLQNVEFAAVIGAVRVTGGEGSQNVWGDGDAQYIVLGADDDTLHGGGGDDYVGSRTGNDVLFGDTGADTVTGGEDNDVVYGNQQNDALYGNQGADTLFGGQDLDALFGGQDGDIAYGNRGEDVIYGNRGADTLFGGQANDTLFGGQGDDTLFGKTGEDLLTGGLGADLFVFQPGGGTDLIADFSFAEGDRLLAQGRNWTVSDSEVGAVVDFGAGDKVTLANIRASQVNGAWFATS